MAGGMNKSGSRVPLGERRRSGRPPPAPSAPPATCPVRHCWVADAIDGSDEKRPGLLVEWRRTPGGWEARVVYAVCVRPGEWALVEEWLPSGVLAPR